MKKCFFCGALLEEDSIFCSFCGKKIEFRSCPHCGTKIEDDSVFCSNCGMRLQDTPEETPSYDTEIQEIDNTPKKSYSLWYITCCIGIVFVLTGGLYALKYLNKPSVKETNTITNVNSEKELSLIGDADGFPLKLFLRIDNGNVTGTYKNVKYGTTITVRGTMVDNVIYLEGTADHTNYEFQIIAEGDNYTGTFGRVGGKKMKLHLRNSPIGDGIIKIGETNRDSDDSIMKKKIKLAFMKAFDDIIDDADLDNFLGGDYMEYFLYDITGDGIPELWIKYGTCEADYEIKVCTYDKDYNYKIIWVSNAGHCGYYEGNGYILQIYAHMGEAFWTKLTYNGKKIVETSIYEETVVEIDDEGNYCYRDYKEPLEKYIELHSFHDAEPINRAIGLE